MTNNKEDLFFSTKVLTADDKYLAENLEEIEVRTQKNAWTLQSLCECFDSSYKIIGLFAGSKLIGFSVIYATKFSTDILTIGVDPDYQGRHLGARLLKDTLKEALNCGATECFLEVRKSNTVARNLYKKFSLEETGIRKEYYAPYGDSPAEDAITMHLSDINKIFN